MRVAPPWAWLLWLAWPLAWPLLSVPPGAVQAARAIRPGKRTHLVMKVHFVEDCKEPQTYAHLLGTDIVNRRDGGDGVNANISVDRDIDSLKLIEMRVYRCRDTRTLDTCEYFTTFSWGTGLCNFLSMSIPVLTPIIRSISPPLACPIRKGLYTANNASWDLDSALMRRMLQNYYWTGTARIWDQDNHNCACVKGGLEAALSRNPSSKQ